MKGDSAKEEFC